MICAGSRLGEDVQQLMREGGEGEVSGIYSTSFYLRFPGNQLLLFCRRDMGGIPFAAGLGPEEIEALKDRMFIGMPVRAEKDGFVFGKGEAAVTFMTPITSQRKPDTPRACTPDYGRWLEAGKLLREIVSVAGTGDGAFFGAPFCTYAAPVVRELIANAADPDREAVEQCVSKLLGLGIGLTPSGDDFLSGFCYGVLRMEGQGGRFGGYLRDSILHLCGQKTGEISAAYLRASAGGKDFQLMETVMEAVEGKGDLREALAKLCAVGGSSGKEMGLGLYLGIGAYIRGR